MRYFFITENDTEAVEQIVLVFANVEKLLKFVSEIRIALLEAKNINRSACAISFNMNTYDFIGEAFFLSEEGSDAYISDSNYEERITDSELEEARERYSCSYMTLYEHGIEFSCEDNCDVRHHIFIENHELQKLDNLQQDSQYDNMIEKIDFLSRYLQTPSADESINGIKIDILITLDLENPDFQELYFLKLMENNEAIGSFVESLISSIVMKFDEGQESLNDFIFYFIENYQNGIYRRAS